MVLIRMTSNMYILPKYICTYQLHKLFGIYFMSNRPTYCTLYTYISEKRVSPLFQSFFQRMPSFSNPKSPKRPFFINTTTTTYYFGYTVLQYTYIYFQPCPKRRRRLIAVNFLLKRM